MEATAHNVPTLFPTFEQWRCFPAYLIRHQASLQRRFGAVKIRPPSRWIPIVKHPNIIRRIKVFLEQKITACTHQSNVFYIEHKELTNRRILNYDNFKDLAESPAFRLGDTENSNMIEHFWSSLTKYKPLLAPCIDCSLFSNEEAIFNMTNLPSLLKYYPNRIRGVTNPRVQLGMWSTTLGLHIDDHDLISIHYLHFGASKVWYVINPSSYAKFEELVNSTKLFRDLSVSCLSPLQHKSLLIDPSFLRSNSIEFYRIEQKVNEIVVIFPGTYHCYFDTGFNVCETVKYALPSWLNFQRKTPRLCSCLHSHSLLTQINRQYFTQDILDRFQQEYLLPIEKSCIDLSKEDDPVELNKTDFDLSSWATSMDMITTDELRLVDNFPMDLSTDATYNWLSSTLINTPMSADFLPPFEKNDEENPIWDIIDEMSKTTRSPTPVLENDSSHPLSTPRIFNHSPISSRKERIKRRKCYLCHRKGHIRNQCRYFSF